MKSLFALRGKSNIGKSQTIRTVVELLTAKHPDAAIEHKLTTKANVRVVLTLNNVKIGIESDGRPNGRLVKESLDLFVSVGCDVIVCATRTSGATADAVNTLQGFDVHWLEQQEKSQLHEQVLRSIGMARAIVEKVDASVELAAPQPARSFSASA